MLTIEARTTMLGAVKLLLLALAFLVLGMTLARCTPPAPAPAVIVEAPKASAVKDEEKVEVAIKTPAKTIKVYGTSVKGKLLIPKEAISNDNLQVTDSVVVSPSERPVQVTPVVDLQTGEVTTYEAAMPTPWFSPESRGSLGLTYGLKRDSVSPVFQLHGRHNFVQTKRIHWGVSGTAYSDGDWYAGAGAEIRW
jgi:hypothetical protein